MTWPRLAEEARHGRTIGVGTGGKAPRIPAAHRDLVECPPVAALTTVTADGYPHTSVVWCDFDGGCIGVNTMRGFVKDRNMRRNLRVTLLCYDPHEPLRYLEVRGRVTGITESGAAEHLDGLASKYAGRPTRFFGDSVPGAVRRDGEPSDLHDPAGPRRHSRRDQKPEDRMTTASTAMARLIPGSHLDLLTRPVHAVLTTMGPDGQPQSSLVWADVQDGAAVVDTTLERRKARNMVANPKVSLLVVDPGNTSRYIQIRGDAELITEGALGHLDAITRKYTGYPAFYGYVCPAGQRARETRAVCRIHARRISLDAIHIADH